MQFQRKISPTILIVTTLIGVLLASSLFASTAVFTHSNSSRAAYAQNSNSSGFGNTTSLVLPNGKTIPINYLMTTGKLLDLTLNKSRATLVVTITAPSDKGNLTIQIPRYVVDDKKEGNADEKFTVHVDGKDATFTEAVSTKTTRTLSILFDKDAKVIDIIGSQSTVQ
ncbi:MAG: hypothetical protein ACJ71P_03740 [Nitrososphaeraceae archaeon]